MLLELGKENAPSLGKLSFENSEKGKEGAASLASTSKDTCTLEIPSVSFALQPGITLETAIKDKKTVT